MILIVMQSFNISVLYLQQVYTAMPHESEYVYNGVQECERLCRGNIFCLSVSFLNENGLMKNNT